MRRVLVTSLAAVSLAIAFAGCFDWNVAPFAAETGAPGDDAPVIDAPANDATVDDASADGADADAGDAAVAVFDCPGADDVTCTRPSQTCCYQSSSWTCEPTGTCNGTSGFDFECTTLTQCPGTQVCCFEGPGGAGTARCRDPDGGCGRTLCVDAGECVAKEAGAGCAMGSAGTAPPFPICQP